MTDQHLEKTYRALGMAVALVKHCNGEKIPDEARAWSGLIRTYAELTNEEIQDIQDVAAGNLKLDGNVTSDAA